MPRTNDFSFDLYRLTTHYTGAVPTPAAGSAQSDDEIISVLKAGCDTQLDFKQETRSAIYVWGLRDFVELPSDEYSDVRAVGVTLAKATLQKDGVIFMPETVQRGTSISQPAPAQVASLIFQLTRHLVAVEANLATAGKAWLRAFLAIVDGAAARLNSGFTVQLQTKPKKSEVLKSFTSFQRLTRLKVQLLLPNPELSRFTKKLFDELSTGGIREYIADMRNPAGLSQQEETLPHAAAAMAEDGYKKGEVVMEGIRDGRREKIKTGTCPARGKVDGIKDFVRGQATTARTHEGKLITDAILKEIDRVSNDV